MRIVVTGATGNIGTSVLAALARDPRVDSILGLARRIPALRIPRTEWVAADVTSSPLERHFAGADAVVHLAWMIQPARDQELLERVNVEGSRRVFEAARAAGVGALVHASSVGAYSPGPKDRAVDESWPTDGIPSNYYSRQKAACERLLDELEAESHAMRVVRIRPALVFKRDAASEIRRIFLGELIRPALVRRELIALVPAAQRLVFQAVHSLDAGQAFALAATRPVSGAFNVAADPVLDRHELARALGARELPVRPEALRALAAAAFRLRLQPTHPSWLDLGTGVPVMDSTRARSELGWAPEHRADEALVELLDGMRDGAGIDTPPLAA